MKNFPIESVVFQCLYDELVDKIYEFELGKPKNYNIYSADLWEERAIKRDKKPKIYQIFFDKDSSDKDYLFKKRSEYQVDKGVLLGTIKTRILIRILEYEHFKIKISAELLKNSLVQTDGIKVQVLYQLFLEKYMPDYFAENKARFTVFDKISQRLFITTKLGKVKNVDPIVVLDTFISIPKERSLTRFIEPAKSKFAKEYDNYAVLKLVKTYFSAVFKQQYSLAIKFWDPSAIKSRGMTSEDFKNLYFPQTEITKNIDVWQINVSETDGVIRAECLVYYEEYIKHLLVTELPNSSLLDPAFDGFNMLLTGLRETCEKLDIEFEDLAFKDFFNVRFQTYLLTHHRTYKNLRSKKENTPRETREKKVIRLYKMKLVLDNAHWLITDAKPLRTHDFLTRDH